MPFAATLLVTCAGLLKKVPLSVVVKKSGAIEFGGVQPSGPRKAVSGNCMHIKDA